MWYVKQFGRRRYDEVLAINWDMRRAVRRVNVAYMGGIPLEELDYTGGRNIAVGVYAEGWRDWYFVNERPLTDPDRAPDFYFDLVLRLLRTKGLEP